MKKIFENTQVAFSLKPDKELKKAYILFKIMSYPSLVKVGAVLTRMLLKFHFPIKGLIRKTVFRQFCGGITEEDCMDTVYHIQQMNVYAILDYSVEGKETEEDFDQTMEHKCQLISFAKAHSEIVFASMKPTALGKLKLWQQRSENQKFSAKDTQAWERIVFRFNKICERAYQDRIPLLIDAEESWMQDAADELATAMMKQYNNTEEVIIYNTIQCYRHDRLAYVKKLHEKGKKEGFKIGVKIVRGAYMEKENYRAKKEGYESPICKDKATTDAMFNGVLTYIIKHINDFSLFVGSHNEESNYLALQLMEQYQIKRNDKRIWFGQLYGMSDHLSFNLGEEAYNAVKLIPFGPIKEVIPYLIRRAEENTSVSGQTGRELTLIKQEIQRRKNT